MQPTLVHLPLNIKSCVVGGSQTLLVCTDGRVFGAGDGRRFGLDTSRVRYLTRFSLIKPLMIYKIISASTGDTHCMFLTSRGKVIVSGDNCYHQLGVPRCKTTRNEDSGMWELYPLDGLKIAMLSCSTYHSILVEREAKSYLSLKQLNFQNRFCDLEFL